MFERLHIGYYALFVLAAIEFSLAFLLGQADLSHYTTTGGFYRMILPMGLVFPLAWAGSVTVKIARRQIDRPTVTLFRMARRDRRWLLRGTLFVFVILMLARSFSSYKGSIQAINPFWADPMLAGLDHAMFGVDPWRITHAVIGPLGTMIIDRAYALWFLMMMLCMGWFAFTRNTKLQLRGLLSYLLTWAVLGNALATALSSVGPCFVEQFYGDDRFSPLMDRLHVIDAEQHRLMALGAMNYLTSNIGKDVVGAGISAMPSLHVSIATLFALACMSYTSSRLLKIVAVLYAATIWVGSVHLGWHYASDGLVGIMVVCLIWWGTGRWVDWLEAREHQRRTAQGATPLPAMS